MNVELDQNEISNLLFALNSTKVNGKDAMVTLLKLMQKLEAALQPPEEVDAV
jgi:hypothetical protein